MGGKLAQPRTLGNLNPQFLFLFTELYFNSEKKLFFRART